MSASEGCPGIQKGIKTSEIIAAYTPVMVDTTNTSATELVVKIATAGAMVIGITYEAQATANRTVGVNLAHPIVPCLVKGSVTPISEGDRLKSDGTYGIKSATDKDEAFAIALAPSTAQGDVIWVLLIGPIERSVT